MNTRKRAISVGAALIALAGLVHAARITSGSGPCTAKATSAQAPTTIDASAAMAARAARAPDGSRDADSRIRGGGHAVLAVTAVAPLRPGRHRSRRPRRLRAR
ncbi:MAG: hypothetical protein BroJett022_05800 [Actinomycetes bacterium]|nr:MAG: hypothetical protein BroJett022_05800 [Actinomycetes bacterium]